MITEQSILEAYIFLRENNHSIPDETLDFMKGASLDKLTEINKYKDNPPCKYKNCNEPSVDIDKTWCRYHDLQING